MLAFFVFFFKDRYLNVKIVSLTYIVWTDVLASSTIMLLLVFPSLPHLLGVHIKHYDYG